MKTIELEPSARIGLHKSRSARIGDPERAETLVVNLPKNVVLMLEELCAAGGIPGGAAGYISHQLVLLIRENPASFCSGIVNDIINAYDFPDDHHTDGLYEIATLWRLDDKRVVKRDRSSAVKLRTPAAMATPKARRRLWIELPEKIRSALRKIADAGGYDENEQSLLGETAVDWRATLDRAAETLVNVRDLSVLQIANIFGIVKLEKIRLSERRHDKTFAEFLHLNTPADKEAAVS